MFTTSRLGVILATVVLLLGVAGVVLGLTLAGGTTGPTKAEFVSRANAICHTAQSQTAPLATQIPTVAASFATGGSGAAARLATLVGRLHGDAASALSRLRALAPPTGDRAVIARFLQPLASVVGDIGTAASTLRGSQPLQALALLQQVPPRAQRAAGAARAYGLADCAGLLSALG